MKTSGLCIDTCMDTMHTSPMTTTQTAAAGYDFTATMTQGGKGVLVTITHRDGNVVETVTTKDGGKFLTRLDNAMSAKGFRRLGYSESNGTLVAEARYYLGRTI